MVFAPAVLQAQALASHRPAQWWPWAATRRSAEVMWTIDCTAEQLLHALRTHVAPSGLDRLLLLLHPSLPQPAWGPFTMLTDEPERGRVVMLWFSPILQFLDVIEVTAAPTSSPPPPSQTLSPRRGKRRSTIFNSTSTRVACVRCPACVTLEGPSPCKTPSVVVAANRSVPATLERCRQTT
jgi:hypothetical protein